MIRDFIIAFAMCACALSMQAAENVSILSQKSEWSFFKGTNEASSPSDVWRGLNYNTDAWSKGIAPFYYGGSVNSGTLLDDMRYGYSSVYMRKEVDLPSGTYSNLKLRSFCDDGFVLWLNGQEVYRFNVPAGEIAHDACSSSVTSSATWSEVDLSKFDNVLLPNQKNVVAVHALNCHLSTSGDFAMDLELLADQIADVTPPTVVSIDPEMNSVVGNPLQITVTFSEPVVGVNRGILYCNEMVAESCTQKSSTTYCLDFPDMPVGKTVSVRWNKNAAIRDMSENKNYFVIPQDTWLYSVSGDIQSKTVIINEFLASNNSGTGLKRNLTSDWVELYNRTSDAINLSGWYLTDSEKNKTKWQFPEGVTIPAKGYLLVFCDETTLAYPANEYHANFSLNSDGEYLGLICADGKTVADEITPSYPKQYTDISYGGGLYFKKPTPGAKNDIGYLEPVERVTFSEPSGYRPSQFNLTMSCATPGATIYYTTDGTEPTSSSIKYSKPIKVDKISFIRAIAVLNGHLDSPISTRTWLFLDEVLSQSNDTPAGWPASYSVNNHKMEYGMNSRQIRNNRKNVSRGLTNVATISFVTDLKNLFDRSKGIYVNPGNDGIAWERPISMELIGVGNQEGFEIGAGLRIRGAYSRSSDNPKHSFRLFFRDTYGGKLNYPLFGDEGGDVFEKVDLRTSQNFSWSFENSSINTFIRETFSRDSQRDMGMPYTRSRYYNLFINGQYWGLYQTQERADSDYAEYYFGGKDEEWDCIKTSQPGYSTEASDGNMTAFSDLYNIAVKQGFTGNYSTNYAWIKGSWEDGTPIPNSPVYLDEDNLITYMLITYFARDPDCPVAVDSHPNNLYGLYNRVSPTGFKWFKHDGEHSMAANRGYPVTYDLTSFGWHLNALSGFNPMRLHQKLMEHPDYKMRWVDTVQKEMVDPNGALSLSNSLARWNAREDELRQVMYAEAARWGHSHNYNTWVDECDYVKNTFIAQSAKILLPQFVNRGWFPKITTPTITKKGGQDGYYAVYGTDTVYYSIDGSDPRLPGGAVNPHAVVLESDPVVAKILLPAGSKWSYFNEGAIPAAQNTRWYQNGYDFSSWKKGAAPLGFGAYPVGTTLVDSINGTPINAVYFATHFDVENAAVLPNITINLRADDGAVVYINGTRVILHNMPTGATYKTYATTDVSGNDELAFVAYELDAKCLQSGDNIVTVEVHQSSAESDDLYFDMEIETEGGVVEGVTQGTINVPTNALLKVRAWNGTEWSALAECDTAVYGDYKDLKVSEMMYASKIPDNPENPDWESDDYAWIELQNCGVGVLDLEGVTFTEGIEYTFPKARMLSGEILVLVKNIEAFSSLYNTNGLFLFDGYKGNFARKGETITIQDPKGKGILSYNYSNKWYPETDRNGYSLAVRDLKAPEALWSTADNWEPCKTLYGTPGVSDNMSALVPPSIKTQPQSLSAYVGDEVVLFVSAVGSLPLTYQWYKNGEPIDGANQNSLVIQRATLAHTGEYCVQITNPAGSVQSYVVTLNVSVVVFDPPTITSQPESVSVALGENASFTVAVSGTSPFTYQWYKNGYEIQDATNSVYLIRAVQNGDVADYSVRVSNRAGSAYSNPIPLSLMGSNVLRKGDFLIGIDDDYSASPNNEEPPNCIDGNVYTKYLNYGGTGAGFITTPSIGMTLVNALCITTANDAEERDPASWALYGTNEPIKSTDGSTGNAENWSLIAAGNVSLPSDRYTAGPVISFANDTPYTSYKVIFPTLKNAGCTMVQLAEIALFGSVWQSGVPTISLVSSYCAFAGNTVTIAPVVMGSLPMTCSWTKDGAPISSENVHIDSAKGTLTLQNVSLSDAGTYVLTARNALGTAQSLPFELIVQMPEKEEIEINYELDGDTLVLYYSGILYQSDDLLNWSPVEDTLEPGVYRVTLGNSEAPSLFFMSAGY